MKGTGKYTEAQFTKDVLELARLNRWRTAHFRPARTATGWRTAVSGDGKGFPDLILIRGSVLLVVELKVPPNRTTPEQNAWLAAWFAVGAVVRVWEPKQWPEIETILEHGEAP